MTNPTISEKAKEALAPALLSYTRLLLEGLTSDGLLTKKPDGQYDHYYIDEKTDITQPISGDLTADQRSFLDNFNLFTELVKNVYNHLKYGDPSNRPFTEVLEAFENRNVFKMPGLEISRMRDILNKGSSLMSDENIQADAMKLFNDQKANFPVYLTQLLEFYTERKVDEIFKEYFVERDTSIKSGLIDLVAKKRDGSEVDILLEIIFRKKPLETLKEDVAKGVDKLSQYNNLNKKDNWLLIILYTDEGTIAIDRIQYRYKQLLDEMFPKRSMRLLFVPVQTGNLHFIDHELKNTLQQIRSAKVSMVEFRFFNQAIQKSLPEIDDHYYDRILNLNVSDFKIVITPQGPIEHWRFGVKFSNSESFPERTQRHGPGYPIFHLEKDARNPVLRISAYGADGNHKFAKDTSMRDYTGQTVTMLISSKGNTTTVDLQSDDGKSILDKPFTVEGLFYGKLFAWADNRNHFEIKTIIEEASSR